MPYTPPAGNAVLFNFSGTYTVPAGNAVVFNFGGGGPPPPQNQLPTGLRQARIAEDDWMFISRRRFAPPIAAAPIALKRRSPLSFMLSDEEWIAPRPLQIRFQPPSRRRRPVMFTIT